MWITAVSVGIEVDDYEIHQRVYRLFSKSIETMGRTFCYRRAGDRVVIYSLGRVNECSKWVELEKSAAYDFTMIACPGRGAYRDENGKRHRMTPRTSIDDVFGWLERRVEGAAFIKTLQGKRLANRKVDRPDGRVMAWPTWLLTGSLSVTQPKSLESHIQSGLGQGAAFGLGLMFLPAVVEGAICSH